MDEHIIFKVHLEEEWVSYSLIPLILSANKHIRKMKGGSPSILVRANDGKHYIIKLHGNPSSCNLLANERLGSAIAKAVGIPVAESKGVFFSDSFIDSHQELWFELPWGDAVRKRRTL
jgi:hypothetical protein